jgi:hypothetical protein
MVQTAEAPPKRPLPTPRELDALSNALSYLSEEVDGLKSLVEDGDTGGGIRDDPRTVTLNPEEAWFLYYYADYMRSTAEEIAASAGKIIEKTGWLYLDGLDKLLSEGKTEAHGIPLQRGGHTGEYLRQIAANRGPVL